MHVLRGTRLSKVTIGILQGHVWKPMRSNSFIIDVGTRTWSKLKTFVSNMKWHRVSNAEEDSSIIQEGVEDPMD